MSDQIDVILELISEVLGEPKRAYESKHQYSYNCPMCDDGNNKGNLEVNLEKNVFHCWSCGEINETHGSLNKLFVKFGTKKQKKLFDLIKPDDLKPIEKKKNKVILPEGYIKISEINPRFPLHLQGLNYLKSRGVTNEIIEKYNIGLTTTGKFANRIVIPSYDLKNNLNYFVARAWFKTKYKYINPEVEKDKIIFNEHLIDWDKDLFLCEGVFDAIFLENSVPLLGKSISQNLFQKIYENAKGYVTICLDGDAWSSAENLYRELNGGLLHGRIRIVKLPKDKDICDLQGQINDYYYKMKD
jgi:DNA primase